MTPHHFYVICCAIVANRDNRPTWNVAICLDERAALERRRQLEDESRAFVTWRYAYFAAHPTPDVPDDDLYDPTYQSASTAWMEATRTAIKVRAREMVVPWPVASETLTLHDTVIFYIDKVADDSSHLEGWRQQCAT